jgi:hypothetical protein
VARHRAALAEALRDGPAARVADARDRQWDILRERLVPSDLPPWGTIYRGSPPGATTGALNG